MTFNGIIHTIDENVFKPFKKLRTLRIKSQNIRNTFQKNNRWLQHLNTNVNIKDFDSLDNEKLLDILFTLAIEQPHPNVTYYSYPNEDLCYFKDFPHHRLILPILKPILTSNFSYTYLFLMHQSRRIETYLNSKLNSLLNTNYESSTYIIELRSYIPIETINSDYFQFINKTLSQCQPHSIVREDTNFYFYLFDYRLLKKYVEIVFSLILNPLFSFICLILNIVSIRIFSDKKIENKAIYRFLIANSIFVCLQTAITIVESTPLGVTSSKKNTLILKIFRKFLSAIVKEFRFRPKFFMSNDAKSLFSRSPNFEMVAYVLKC